MLEEYITVAATGLAGTHERPHVAKVHERLIHKQWRVSVMTTARQMDLFGGSTMAHLF